MTFDAYSETRTKKDNKRPYRVCSRLFHVSSVSVCYPVFACYHGEPEALLQAARLSFFAFSKSLGKTGKQPLPPSIPILRPSYQSDTYFLLYHIQLPYFGLYFM